MLILNEILGLLFGTLLVLVIAIIGSRAGLEYSFLAILIAIFLIGSSYFDFFYQWPQVISTIIGAILGYFIWQARPAIATRLNLVF